MGQLLISRMVRLVTVISSSRAPSTVSSARPPQPSKTQLEMAILYESAVGLGATLDAAGAAAPPLVGAVEHRASSSSR